MTGVLLRANQTSSLLGAYDGGSLKIYATDGRRFDEQAVLDVACEDFAFLPDWVGPAVLVISKASAALYHPSEDPCVYIGVPIEGVSGFDGCLKVSSFAENILFGFISNGSVHVYELQLDVWRPRPLVLRRYACPEPISWFDFSASLTLCAVSEKQLLFFRVDRNAPVEKVALPDHCSDVLSGAVSPTSANRIALLTRDGSVCVRDDEFRQTNHKLPGANSIQWSPFGCSLVVTFPDNTYRILRNVRADTWELSE